MLRVTRILIATVALIALLLVGAFLWDVFRPVVRLTVILPDDSVRGYPIRYSRASPVFEDGILVVSCTSSGCEIPEATGVFRGTIGKIANSRTKDGKVLLVEDRWPFSESVRALRGPVPGNDGTSLLIYGTKKDSEEVRRKLEDESLYR